MIKITDLAREQLSDDWSGRERGMSLDQAVALRADELTETILTKFGNILTKTNKTGANSEMTRPG